MPKIKGHVPSRINDKTFSPKRTASVWKTIRFNLGPITISSFKAYCLINLTLFASEILRSSLDPVYGSIPASRYHGIATSTALFAACSTSTLWKGSSQDWARTLALTALGASFMQIYLFRYSGTLGPIAGPLISALITTVPIILTCGITAAKELTQAIEKTARRGTSQKDRVPGSSIARLLNGVLSLTAYREPKIGSHLLLEWLRTKGLYSRIGLHYILATSYACLHTSRYHLLLIPPTLQIALFNSYFPHPYSNHILNTTLHKHGYSLIARQESTTGYISVLDNLKDGFRVMRCDHSLLGGSWIPPAGYVVRVHEPIYAVFVMLEAVRLVQPEPGIRRSSDDENALVIGLGIGTTPSALLAHNISTTILEIDPVVHAFATEYFSLPGNHTAVIQDALVFVSDRQSNTSNKEKYTYIIHDVFTGGAEPLPLFTVEFLQGLKDMLKPEGVIAINYAGDLSLPTATRVIFTILSVFSPHSCRLFREEPAPAPSPSPPSLSSSSPNSNSPPPDFTNLVLFCLATNPHQAHPHARNQKPFSFRPPVAADFLGSQARAEHLLPRWEVDAESFLHDGRKKGKGKGKWEGGVIRAKDVKGMEAGQMESARGHWRVMRSVLPDGVWENW
ncbi:MAG: hypothetical protein Q9184_002363 [Pyrenodesmia sp. 2 TL-2023]